MEGNLTLRNSRMQDQETVNIAVIFPVHNYMYMGVVICNIYVYYIYVMHTLCVRHNFYIHMYIYITSELFRQGEDRRRGMLSCGSV